MTAADDATTRPGTRFREVDALRGVAAVAVLASHVTEMHARGVQTPWREISAALDAGVVVFFVISGFVLYRPFALALRGAERVGLREFAVRRFFRIAPPYWVALAVLGVVFSLPGVYSEDWWRYFGFAQIYSGATLNLGLPPAWTLDVEVTFYVALVLIALALGALRRSRPGSFRLEVVVFGLLGAGSLVFQYWVESRGGAEIRFLTTTLLGTLYWFVLGMLLAAACVDQSAVAGYLRRLGGRTTLLLAIAALAFATRLTSDDPIPASLNDAIAGVFAIALVAPAVLAAPDGRYRRGLRGRWILALGAISYSLYLWHWPIVRWLSEHGFDQPWSLALGGVAASIPVAAVAYAVVERPSHRLGRKLGLRVRGA